MYFKMMYLMIENNLKKAIKKVNAKKKPAKKMTMAQKMKMLRSKSKKK